MFLLILGIKSSQLCINFGLRAHNFLSIYGPQSSQLFVNLGPKVYSFISILGPQSSQLFPIFGPWNSQLFVKDRTNSKGRLGIKPGGVQKWPKSNNLGPSIRQCREHNSRVTPEGARLRTLLFQSIS